MSQFVPRGMRPPGLFPMAERVIYKTKRKNLTHEGRIGRISKQETLDAFRAFSHAFHAHRPRLEPELGGYLHNIGFLPDRGEIFGLSPDLIDPEDPEAHSKELGHYLTDFQAMILPLANGRYAAAGSNRLLLWQLHQKVLPLAPMLATRQRGQLHQHQEPPKDAHPRPLARPLATGSKAAPIWGTPEEAGEDSLFLALPEASHGTPQQIIRMAVVFDPSTKHPAILSAVQLEAPLAALDQPGQEILCRRIDPETGIAGPAQRFLRDTATSPQIEDPSSRAVPEWWSAMLAILSGLSALPIWAVMQFDVIATENGPMIVDMTDHLDVTALQLDGPIMGSKTAIHFIKEFGV